MRTAVAILLLLAMPAVAGPGHGLVASEETMYIHLLNDRLALQPSAPVGAVLADPSEALPACGTALRWQAGFTQAVPDASGAAAVIPELARNATWDFGTRPSFNFYIESVMPGTGQPAPLLMTQVNATVSLRTGDDLSAWRDGQTIAETKESVALTSVAAGDLQVYRLDLRPNWAGAIELQPGETLQLEIEMEFGIPDCPTGWPGIRAYSADGLRPRLIWLLYDPIRIENITATPSGDQVVINITAASPWGASRIAPIETPAIAGSGGPATGIQPQGYLADGIVQASWMWNRGTAPNGTYRADVLVKSVQGDFQTTDFVLFKMGADGPVAPPPPPPKEESPVPVAFVLVALGAALWVARRR